MTETPCECRCRLHPHGCPRDAHTHYRPGADCGCCGAAVCRRYRAAIRIPAPSPDPEAFPA